MQEKNIFDMNNIPQEKFEFTNSNERLHDKKLETKQMSYFEDVLRRFAKNKSSVVAAFIMTLLFRNPKIYYGMWVFSFLIAATHITVFAQIFSGLTTEHGAGYLLGEGGTEGTKGGFRIDFILYSAVPLFVGWYAMFKKKIKLSRRYLNLLNLYVCLNSVWMLCMYIEFTNRVAYLSWFLYPIVLVYPFLQEQWGKNRYKVFSLVMLGHLGFTVIMNLLVYV